MGLNPIPTLTQFGYGGALQLVAMTSGNTGASYWYLASSPLIGQVQFTNNGVRRMITTKQYDNLNQLTAIWSAPSASSAVGFNY